jgi:hypothetical protein
MLTLALLFAQAVTPAPVVKPAPPLRHTLAGEKPHIVMPKAPTWKPCTDGYVHMGHPSCVADPKVDYKTLMKPIGGTK